MDWYDQFDVLVWRAASEMHVIEECRGAARRMNDETEWFAVPVAKLHIDHHENQREYHSSYLAELCHVCGKDLVVYLASFTDELAHVERVLLTRPSPSEDLLKRYTFLKDANDARDLLEERASSRAEACLTVLDAMAAELRSVLASPQGRKEVTTLCARAALGDPPVLVEAPSVAAVQSALSAHWEAAAQELADAPTWVLVSMPHRRVRSSNTVLRLALEVFEGGTGVMLAPLAVHALKQKEFADYDSIVLPGPLTDEVLDTVRSLVRDARSKGDWTEDLKEILEVARALV